ncbi:acyltransferase [Georgenia halophila]|uniref:Acyltransferase n=1 Tax=Georgenia halophila TaxID=620889 RepID=A0ABP8LEI6_9MICO
MAINLDTSPADTRRPDVLPRPVTAPIERPDNRRTSGRPTEPPARRRRHLRRDVFIDTTRALGTLCVVLVHWLMPEATWYGETLHIGNALGHEYAWVLTWVLQVLPLLFFAAGAAAAYQLATTPDGRWLATLGTRLRAIARPVGAFVAAWAVAIPVLLLLGVPDSAVWRIARMAPQLLWFLGVWVALIVVAPVFLRAWRRWRWAAMGTALTLPLAVDAVRFAAGAEQLAWANLVLVWAVPFLAGIAYAADRLAGRRAPADASTWLLAGALAGLSAMALLVAEGPYPPSMIGMPGDPISNLGPPTAAIVAQAVMQVCAVLLARTALVRWAARRRGRAVVHTLARHSMTIYLWHLTAMFAVVGVALLALDVTLPEPWSADWWASRPTWFGAFVLVLALLVRVFGRFERPSSRRRQPRAATASISTS